MHPGSPPGKESDRTESRDSQILPTELLCSFYPGGKEGETSRKGKPSTLGQGSLRCLATPNPTPISRVQLASSYSSELQSPPQPRPWYLGHGLSGRIATDGASPLSLAIQLPLRHLDHPVHHLEAGRQGKGGQRIQESRRGPKASPKASLRQSPETRVLQRQSFGHSPFCPQGFQPSPHPTPTSTPNLLLPDPLPPASHPCGSPHLHRLLQARSPLDRLITSLNPNPTPGSTCRHLAPSLTWPPFSVRKTYLTLGSGKVAADWMLAIATLVGSSPVATAPELKEQRKSLRLTAFLPLFHLHVIQKNQGAQEICPWRRGRSQAGPLVSGLFL